jgi:hypothetical protein
LLFEKGVLLFEKGVLLFEKGVLLFEKGVLLFETGVLLFEKGVLLFENGVFSRVEFLFKYWFVSCTQVVDTFFSTSRLLPVAIQKHVS